MSKRENVCMVKTRPTTVFEHCLCCQENVSGDQVKYASIFKLKRG